MANRRISLWALIGVVGIALPAAIVGLVLWLSTDTREATHRFFAHVRAHRDAEAYAMASRNLRSSVPASGFGAYLDQNAAPVRRSGGEWVNGFVGGFGSVCVEVWLNGGSSDTVYVLLVDEDDAWRVEGVGAGECDDD